MPDSGSPSSTVRFSTSTGSIENVLRSETSSPDDTLRVAIDARISSGTSGGVESVVIGLAHGLSQLTDGLEEYFFLAYEGHDAWIRRHVSGRCRVMTVPDPGRSLRLAREFVRRRTPRLAAGVRATRRAWQELTKREAFGVPVSDGSLEAAGIDVVHFPIQAGFLTDLPSIYHPHDLQHLHLPQFFTTDEYRYRELIYRALCSDSTMVAVASNWVRSDVIGSYQLPEDKVVVIPLAPPLDAYTDPSADAVARTRSRYRLPPEFVLYPAATWPHKNHLRLLEALATLRERDLKVPLVCTGMQTSHFNTILEHAERLHLIHDVVFLGFVPPQELASLYASARAVVIPTEFEAASFPVWEAFRAGVPVACSNVTSLPEQTGDAAVLFEPHDVAGIARSIEQLWTDGGLRRTLKKRGRAQVARFNWLRTARTFRAHYRRIAGHSMSDRDLDLIASPPSLEAPPQ
jgi:glycosyltransferase involved in cell wall biosynthesis